MSKILRRLGIAAGLVTVLGCSSPKPIVHSAEDAAEIALKGLESGEMERMFEEMRKTGTPEFERKLEGIIAADEKKLMDIVLGYRVENLHSEQKSIPGGYEITYSLQPWSQHGGIDYSAKGTIFTVELRKISVPQLYRGPPLWVENPTIDFDITISKHPKLKRDYSVSGAINNKGNMRLSFDGQFDDFASKEMPDISRNRGYIETSSPHRYNPNVRIKRFAGFGGTIFEADIDEKTIQPYKDFLDKVVEKYQARQ